MKLNLMLLKNLINLEKISNLQNKISSSPILTIQEGCDKFCHFCVVPIQEAQSIQDPLNKF